MTDAPTTPEFDLPRRLAAEAIGTAILLAGIVGSGIMAERLAGGNEAIALLANMAATGAILAVLILVFGPISGGHFNPAVTVSFVMQRALRPGTAAAYIAVQIVAALVGVALAHLMFDEPLVQAAVKTRSGPGIWAAEVVATAGLVATIIGCLRFRPEAVAYAVGLYISAGYWFTASTSFANPAVTIGRAFTDSFTGIRAADAPAFIVAEMVGAVAATLVFRWLLADRRNDPEV